MQHLTQVIKLGEKTPLWSAQSNHGEVRIADCLGKTAVLVLFYAADWTDVCSDELPLLEELIKLAGEVNLTTFGVSEDSIASHKAFARQIGLKNIILISDPEREISRSYGVMDHNNLCRRAAVLIDKEGIVQWVRVEEAVDQPRPLAEMEKALQIVREWSGYSDKIENWEDERRLVMQLYREKPLAKPTQLDLHFWGTRGSIPVSGVEHVRYGGNTSCVSVTSNAGHLFVFDCGSGARELGNYLLSPAWKTTDHINGRKNLTGYILLSHTHWDHIQGFPFFAPIFIPGNRFNIIGWSNCSQTLASILAGQMEQIYFPVSLESVPSELRFYSIQCGDAELDEVQVTAQQLHHPIPSTAYRLEIGGKIIVYATDHEPLSLPEMKSDELLGDEVVDKKLVRLAKDADILIHDAQYSTSQLAAKKGWGHNSAEVAVDTALKAGVKHLVLFHHDPAHSDATVDALLSSAHQRLHSLGRDDLKIISAHDGLNLKL